MINIVELQQAIWNKLNESNRTIVDYIEYNQIDPPYVRIGDLYIDDNSVKNAKGLRCEQFINIYSIYSGKKELLEIIDEINDLMLDLQIEGFYVYVKRGTQTVMLDTDRKTIFSNRDSQVKYYHALLKYEIYIG